MEDRPKQNTALQRPLRRLALIVFCGFLLLSQSGCSLFVMAGKMIFGDPVLPCAFTEQTKIDLTKGDYKVVVVCKAPEVLTEGYSSLQVDLLAETSRRLKREGIEIVNPNKVASWLDDNLGDFDDPTYLAQEFEADLVLVIDVESFSYKEESKNTLLRGRTSAQLTAYELRGDDENELAVQIFAREFVSKYPELYPVPIESISEITFRKRYLDRISQHIAQHFYNHRASDAIY